MGLKEHQTKYIAIKSNGLWEIHVDSFGKPAPIGPRLAKRIPLPDYPRFATTQEEAFGLVGKWNEWSKETQPKTKKRKKK